MNKQELCDHVAKETNLPKTQIMSVIDSTFESIGSSLKKGQEVRLVGFGTWKRIKRKARPGRNPQTGKAITIKARNVAKFSMGQGLFDLIN
ncbi:HU family DNA-binding protein [Candidatus Saganbacteria bacterium]|nr:HU family DNA-binding protein [Candidatus Saganbacteria bacterium]